jgi:hypothetical protein
MTVRFVYAATFDDPEDAEAFRRRLLDDGVVAGLVPITEPGHRDAGKIRLEVQEEFAADVHRLLADRPGVVRAGEKETGPSWLCPGCQAEIPETRFTCPKCRCLRPPQAQPAHNAPGSAEVTEPRAISPPVEPSETFPAAASGPQVGLPPIRPVDRFGSPRREWRLAGLSLLGMITLTLLAANSGLFCFVFPIGLLSASSLFRACRYWPRQQDRDLETRAKVRAAIGFYVVAVLLGLLGLVCLMYPG